MIKAVADTELFVKGGGALTDLKGGVQSCFCDSLYNQPISPMKGGPRINKKV